MDAYTDTKLSDGMDTELPSQRDPKRVLADQATKTAVRQLEEGIKARAERFADIAKNEAQYRGEKTKALRGRHNIPFDAVVARGFVDTLLSKVDERLQISFERAPGRQQDKKAAEKISAVCDHESGPDQGAWDLKDLGVKKLATFSGRGIYAKYAERVDGEFVDHFEVVDHWDFVTEKGGGGFLDEHKYKGRMNVLLDRSDIMTMCDAGVYDRKQAYKIFASTTDDQKKSNSAIYQHKVSRMQDLGIDAAENGEKGSEIYRFVQWVMKFRGKWYWLVFNYDTGIWIRFEPLEDVFSVAKRKKGRGPWVSWATHFDPFDFWSIAPMDSVRPIGVSIKKTLNYALDNLEKRNWQQTAYDPNVFNPKDLLWKDQGLVKANIRANQSVANHIYSFETPDTTMITVNLVEFMNNFLGEKTGITPGAQGQADDGKVGIYFGNIQQVADRLGLTNKMYEQAHIDIGVNFQYGLMDHMPEKYAVKVIGNAGIEWDEELKREEAGRIFSIRVRGTSTEEKQNAVLAQRKQASLMMIARDPELRQRTNQSWRLRETLKLGGYDAEDVRVALDTNSEADDDILSEAAQAIEDIINGRTPRKNRGATTGYVRKILDYAYDTELDDAVFKRLVAFAQMHVPVAKENADRKVSQLMAAAGAAGMGATAPGVPSGARGAGMPPPAPLSQNGGSPALPSPSPAGAMM